MKFILSEEEIKEAIEIYFIDKTKYLFRDESFNIIFEGPDTAQVMQEIMEVGCIIELKKPFVLNLPSFGMDHV